MSVIVISRQSCQSRLASPEKGLIFTAEKTIMFWARSPAKLFGCTALLLFLARLISPPADFPGALQARSYLHLLGYRLDLTGYGLFEFAAVVFLFSALLYYLIQRLTGRAPNAILIQLHFWPSLLFAAFSIFFAHWVNHKTAAEVRDPANRAFISSLSFAFTSGFIAFIMLQIVFVNCAIRSIQRNRHADTEP
jgi:hypothetical protein